MWITILYTIPPFSNLLIQDIECAVCDLNTRIYQPIPNLFAKKLAKFKRMMMEYRTEYDAD